MHPLTPLHYSQHDGKPSYGGLTSMYNTDCGRFTIILGLDDDKSWGICSTEDYYPMPWQVWLQEQAINDIEVTTRREALEILFACLQGSGLLDAEHPSVTV